MKKYIQAQGYRFKGDYDDMADKQFYLLEAAYESSDNSTLSNLVFDASETYVLFLKAFNMTIFKTTLQNIINAANEDGLCAAIGNSISVERQENGYMITMNFITRGD